MKPDLRRGRSRSPEVCQPSRSGNTTNKNMNMNTDNQPTHPHDILTVPEASNLLGPNGPGYQTIYDAVRLGRIPKVPDDRTGGKKPKVLVHWQDVQSWWQAKLAKTNGTAPAGNPPVESTPASVADTPGTSPIPRKKVEEQEPVARHTSPRVSSRPAPEPTPAPRVANNNPGHTGKGTPPAISGANGSRRHGKPNRRPRPELQPLAANKSGNSDPASDSDRTKVRTSRPLPVLKNFLRSLDCEKARDICAWLNNRLLNGYHRRPERVAPTNS